MISFEIQIGQVTQYLDHFLEKNMGYFKNLKTGRSPDIEAIV